MMEEPAAQPQPHAQQQQRVVDQELTCVLVGDAAVGKTRLIVQAVGGDYTDMGEHSATEYVTFVEVDDRHFRLTLVDTSGQDAPQQQPSQSLYANASVVFVCFSVISPSSLQNVTTKWIPEVAKNAPGVPIVLLATKIDLRDNETLCERLESKGMRPVATEEGESVCKRPDVSALAYYEVSAASEGNPFIRVFTHSIRLVLDPPKAEPKRERDGRKCVLM